MAKHSNRRSGAPSKKRRQSAPSTHAFSSGGKRRKLEITFDPEARREYLTGFSARKKERRAFGLAMQKVKDRREKLDERRENRAAKMEQVREIEQAKRLQRGEKEAECDADADEEEGGEGGNVRRSEELGDVEDKGLTQGVVRDARDASNQSTDEPATMTTTTYQDSSIQHQFGGSVIVTTTFGIPDDSDDDDAATDALLRARRHGPDHVDVEQRYAGNVQRYIAELKGNMPPKKSKNHHHGSVAKKGRHGAADMKGMGGAATLKAAQKTLSKYRAKNADPEDRDGKKRKRGGKGIKGKRR